MTKKNMVTVTMQVELNDELLNALLASLQARRDGASKQDQGWYDEQIDKANMYQPDPDELAEFIAWEAGFQSSTGNPVMVSDYEQKD